MPATVDMQTDADVLAGRVSEVEAPAGTDDDRRGIGGLLAHRDDAPAQFTGGPQRVDQMQVVVGEQRGGQPGHRATQDVGERLLPWRDVCRRLLDPFLQAHPTVSPHSGYGSVGYQRLRKRRLSKRRSSHL